MCIRDRSLLVQQSHAKEDCFSFTARATAVWARYVLMGALLFLVLKITTNGQRFTIVKDVKQKTLSNLQTIQNLYCINVLKAKKKNAGKSCYIRLKLLWREQYKCRWTVFQINKNCTNCSIKRRTLHTTNVPSPVTTPDVYKRQQCASTMITYCEVICEYDCLSYSPVIPLYDFFFYPKINMELKWKRF